MTADPALAALRQTRAQQLAVQRWLRLAGPALICFLGWICWHSRPGPGLSGRGLAVSLAFAGFVAGVLGVRAVQSSLGGTGRFPGAPATPARPGPALLAPVARRARLPGTHGAFLVLLLASSGVLLWAQPGGAGVIGLIASALLVSRWRSGLPRLLLMLAACLTLAVAAVLDSNGAQVRALAGMVALCAFYAMTYLANRLGEANEQAERLLVELESTRAAEAKAAGLAERQRLAREMHDVLAHSLSGMMLQLEAARMLAAADVSDPRLPGAIERAHHLGSAGLAEASRAIGMLRDEELPGPERLPGLAARFEADRGVPCELTVSGQACPLTSEARLALYRVAQEALTNIAKHATPELVRMSLAYETGGARLTVEDFAAAAGAAPGGGAPPAVPGGGYGLTGMRERAELLGGDLVAAATGRGFRVELRVPA
jgi:signal transduction histidine kinase